MNDVTLVGMTEDLNLNANLYGFVGLAELVFPGRILACFMVGSQATSEAVGASDVDLALVFRDRFQEGEAERFEFFRRYVGSLSRVPIDLSGVEEARLLTEGAVHLKQSSLLLMGEDLRERIPLMSMEAWRRLCMHRPYAFMERGRSRPEDAPLRYPLTYPDPAGALYGYDHRAHVEADGSVHRGVKELVTLACWLATALLALDAGVYAVSKREAVELYRTRVNDAWASLFEEVYAHRARWGYRVPDAPEEQARVRALCGRMLAAENHFLLRYKDFLLAELRHGETPHRVRAARQLGLIVYPGDEVPTALRALVEEPATEEPLRQEARESLSRLERYA